MPRARKPRLTKEQLEQKFSSALNMLYTVNPDAHDDWCERLCDDEGELLLEKLSQTTLNLIKKQTFSEIETIREDEDEEETDEEVSQPPLRFG